MKIGRQIAMTAYLKPEQKQALQKLSKTTDIPMQEYIREGVDMALEKHGQTQTRGEK